MNMRKGEIAALGLFILIYGVFIFFDASQGAYHTGFHRIFDDRLQMQGHDPITFDITLKNQTNYSFTLSVDYLLDENENVNVEEDERLTLNVNINISYLDANVMPIIIHPSHIQDVIQGEFISNKSGNYTFNLREHEGNSYPIFFHLDEKIVTYFPDGGRYGYIRSYFKNIAIFLMILGIGLLVYIFREDLRKFRKS